VDVCPAAALKRIGGYYSVEELMALLLRDRAFYRHSGGGVSLSGGECTMFPSYLRSLLEELKAHGIHVVLETGGYFNFNTFRTMILPYLDLIYFDIKFADPEAHHKYCGISNRRILDNFRLLMQMSSIPVHPRIPLIPGITSTQENISAIADFLRHEGATQCSLLRYNPMGLDKYEVIGKEAPDLPRGFMEVTEVKEAYNALLMK
jgi:pyruvate formate lyase activating enzyme